MVKIEQLKNWFLIYKSDKINAVIGNNELHIVAGVNEIALIIVQKMLIKR